MDPRFSFFFFFCYNF
uniref:Uncharacterized protein LOC105115765 n=1 Tax=Rhizophora mucronata TaxID=61149 RepID=A0A2P2Q326_RHIMU